MKRRVGGGSGYAMRSLLRAVIVACVAASLVVASGCIGVTDGQEKDATAGAGDERAELTIAIAGMVIPEAGFAYYQDLSRYVAGKVGRKLRLVHKAEYAEVNEMLRHGDVDVAFVCSGPYVSGHDEFGLELLAAPVVNGAPQYYCYVISAKDSPVASLEDLRGKTFAFTDPQSNTGCLVPRYLLARMGATPEDFFARTFYTYGHDNSVKAVATGEADGAAVDSLVYDYSAATDPTYTSRTKVVFKSDPFGIPPVVTRPGLDEDLKERLRDVFLDADEDPEGRAILEKMHVEEFVVVEDSDYDSIREMNDWIAKKR